MPELPHGSRASATSTVDGRWRQPTDPAAMRLMSVPDPAPPYDDTIADSGPAQGLSVPAVNRANFADQDKPEQVTTAGPTRQLTGWPVHFAQVMAETLAGSRPADQLRQWTTEQARRRIRQLGPALSDGQRPRVRKIMTSTPNPDVVEITAVVRFGPRTRVLALRLERAEARGGTVQQRGGPPRQQWLCTAIESA